MGEFKKNIPCGKRTKYHANGKNIYEGEFINGKFEGNGKYIWEDDKYYISQFNGLEMEKEQSIMQMEKFNVKVII